MAVRGSRNGTAPVALGEDSSLHGRAAAAAGEDELRPAVRGACALSVLVEGTAAILMHRYDVAAIGVAPCVKTAGPPRLSNSLPSLR